MTSERRRSPGDGRGLTRGYFAPCAQCGEVVVHADSTNRPFHMHARSEKCRKAAETNAATTRKKTRP